MVRPRKISSFKPTLTNLAQTSHYLVQFGGLDVQLRKHLNVRGIDYRFITNTSGILCQSAVLPGSGMATVKINGNRMGVTENMVHSRIYTPIQLEFYVDNEYKALKFLEHWMEFIANGATSRQNNQSKKNYHVRMQYPDDYKCDETRIIKFDRDYREELEYKFIGMFPSDLTSVPVKYDNSQILKVNATFKFDRYVVGRFDSYSVNRGTANNIAGSKKVPSSNRDNRDDGNIFGIEMKTKADSSAYSTLSNTLDTFTLTQGRRI